MNLSLVIPAYNEEKYLPRTLEALKLAVGERPSVELIVVDNESSDNTASIAEEAGASIVREIERNIGKVRNTGASSAKGETIVFIDADTSVRPGVFEKIIEAMRDPNCFGGSVAAEYEGELRRVWVRWFMKLWPLLGKLTKMRGGALQFCRAEVFRELGGYDTTIFVGEDIEFHWRLDKLAKTRGGYTAFIEDPKVLTSSRRWDRMGLFRMLFFTHPVTILLAWRYRSFWKDWYERAIR
jgi:glycosyltransferase involved in cell wall biosynthesis